MARPVHGFLSQVFQRRSMGVRMMTTMIALTKTRPSVEPISDEETAGGVLVTTTVGVPAFPKAAGCPTAALTRASIRPMTINTAGRRMCKGFFIRLRQVYHLPRRLVHSGQWV